MAKAMTAEMIWNKFRILLSSHLSILLYYVQDGHSTEFSTLRIWKERTMGINGIQ